MKNKHREYHNVIIYKKKRKFFMKNNRNENTRQFKN